MPESPKHSIHVGLMFAVFNIDRRQTNLKLAGQMRQCRRIKAGAERVQCP